MRDIYTASPGLPQDLSCRKQFALKNESQKLPAIQEDSEACLPPIATFSHHRQNRIGPCSSYVGKSGKSVGRKRQKQPRSRHTENKFYCDWPQCPRFLLKKPFKQMTHLKHHLLLHKNHLNLSCSQCGKRFSSKENLKRHTNVHSGLKPYICSICRQAYSRTSERSRCMKKHHFEDKYFSEQDKQCLYKDVYSDWNSSGLSALQIEDKINQSRPRPYICQICNDHRAYTDPSSLRKHMRSHHTNCKNEKSMTDRDSTNETVISKSKLSKIVQYEEPISLVLANSTTDIDAVDSSHLSFDNSFTTESKSLLLTTDSVYPVVIAPYNALTTSMTSSEIPVTTNVMISFNNNNVITESNISTNIINTPRYHLLLRSDSIVSSTMMTVISMTSTTTTNTTTTTLKNEYDGDVAVDLCNSALCLQVYSDKTYTSVSSSELGRVDSLTLPLSTVNSSNSIIPQYITETNRIIDNGLSSKNLFYSNSGLDLTDTHYLTLTGATEAIDLSFDPSVDIITVNPIDLSSSQHCTTLFFESTNECTDNTFFTTHTIWDPEPGFSFTDLLLTNNDEECETEYPEVIIYPESAVYRSNETSTSFTTTSHNDNNNSTVISSELKISDTLISPMNSHCIPSDTLTTTIKTTSTGGEGGYNVQPPPLDLRLIQSNNFYS
uniref:C2H2-type domain-containing protein n=1 Tax=Schistosoma mansoni TaxID=6183 RepID=A0A5K4FEE8_SCHMA